MIDLFPRDCWDKNCQYFSIVDLSVDDLECTCKLLGKSIDACDEMFFFSVCPIQEGSDKMYKCIYCKKHSEKGKNYCQLTGQVFKRTCKGYTPYQLKNPRRKNHCLNFTARLIDRFDAWVHQY